VYGNESICGVCCYHVQFFLSNIPCPFAPPPTPV
jgi:hypothetical protein